MELMAQARRDTVQQMNARPAAEQRRKQADVFMIGQDHHWARIVKKLILFCDVANMQILTVEMTNLGLEGRRQINPATLKPIGTKDGYQDRITLIPIPEIISRPKLATFSKEAPVTGAEGCVHPRIVARGNNSQSEKGLWFTCVVCNYVVQSPAQHLRVSASRYSYLFS